MPNPSAYAGGYSEGIRRQLNQVDVPDKIKCSVCNKVRMQSAFSKRQIDIFRNVMVTRDGNPTSGPGLAKCRHCVGSQSVELTCTVCDRTKGLEDFAKSQRANRDNARCLACVQRLGLVDPVIEGRKLLMENARKGDTMGMREDEKSVSDFQKMSMDPSVDDDDDMSVGGGVWVESDNDGDDNTSVGKGKEAMSTKPSTKAETESMASSRHTSLADWGDMGVRSTMSFTPHRRDSVPPKKESRFARVPASYVDDDDQPKIRIPDSDDGGEVASNSDSDDDNHGGPESYI